jgi:hypothetical protein
MPLKCRSVDTVYRGARDGLRRVEEERCNRMYGKRTNMTQVRKFMVAACLALTAALGWATAFEAKNFDQLVTEADQIFVGTAATAAARKLPAGAIVTDVTFNRIQMLKGNSMDTAVTLMTAGGSVGGETFELRGLPKFRLDTTYVVFSQGNGTTIFPVVGGDQGMFQVKTDASTAESLVFNSRGMPVASPSVLQALGLTGPSPMPLAAFLGAIRSRLP